MLAERVFESDSLEQTEELAAQIGAGLEAGDVLALDGELGSGKTSFVRGLALGLGVGEPVSSPTYVLMNAYVGRLDLYHFDAWMEGREQAFLADGGDEWLRAGGVAVIEWASRVSDWLPLPRLEVVLEHQGPERRRIRLGVAGTPGQDAGRLLGLLQRLAPPGGPAA